jgi:hypothetical protein
MGVLKKDGLTAAIRHYFGKNWLWILLILIPLLIPAGITYAAVCLKMVKDIRHIKISHIDIMIFLIFAEYYLFLPGAITAPRYQLPALPCLCMLAAAAILQLTVKKNVDQTENSAEMDSQVESAV